MNAQQFVRQHYLDFLGREPDQGGWDFWTAQVSKAGPVEVSRAFWLVAEPALFDRSGGCLNSEQFITLCYKFYLQRTIDPADPGYQFWLAELKRDANVVGVRHLISAFINSDDYNARFPQGNVEPPRPVFPDYVEPQPIGEVVEIA